jgi:hypothetical protein
VTYTLIVTESYASPETGTYMKLDALVVMERGMDRAKFIEGFGGLRSAPKLVQIAETVTFARAQLTAGTGAADATQSSRNFVHKFWRDHLQASANPLYLLTSDVNPGDSSAAFRWTTGVVSPTRTAYCKVRFTSYKFYHEAGKRPICDLTFELIS